MHEINNSETHTTDPGKDRRSKKKQVIRLTLALLVLVGVILLTKVLTGSEGALDFVGSLGYLGLFAVSIVSGFNVIVPIPVASFIPLLAEAGLDFWLSVLVVTLGMTVGDGVGLVLGKIGRSFFSDEKMPEWLRRAHAYALRYRFGTFFLMFFYAAFAPTPNEVLVIPLAFLGTRSSTILGAVFLGNIVFNILTALGISGVLLLV